MKMKKRVECGGGGRNLSKLKENKVKRRKKLIQYTNLLSQLSSGKKYLLLYTAEYFILTDVKYNDFFHKMF